ncbi:unnamed protein product [Microthlaspi erraticum]|uniref:Uncharacterized protein n=1 Tax=Microthlaspi erraticum TaxID=1685480 RepID=A0A6D2LGS2_9BRAS|nr:unnamed protein product [Microthlaspi erraticum]
MDNRETGLGREESGIRRNNPQVSSALVTVGQNRKLRDPRLPHASSQKEDLPLASSQKEDPKLAEIRHKFFTVFPLVASLYYQTKGKRDWSWRWLDITLSIIRAVMHGTEEEKLAARASVNTLKTLCDDNKTIRIMEKGVLHVEQRVKKGQADKIELESKINEKKVAITEKEDALSKLKQQTEVLVSALKKMKEEAETSETCLIRLKNEKQAMEGRLDRLKHKKYHLEFDQIVRT